MTQNRKRGRDQFEDETDFMPLSKRINDLYINNSNYMGQLPESPPGSDGGTVGWSRCAHPTSQQHYSPDLNESENPHYFSINKLLFEMYLQRVQRGCHQI